MLNNIGSVRISNTTIFITLALSYLVDNVYLISQVPALRMFQLLSQYCLILIMIGYIFTNRVRAGTLLLCVTVVSVFTLSLLFSGKFVLLKYAVVLVFLMFCHTKNLYRKLFNLYAVFILTIFILGAVGILPSSIARRGYSTLGFSHPNTFALCIFSTFCCYVIMQERKLDARNYMVLAFGILLTLLLTDSRTTVIAMIGFFTILFLLERTNLLLSGKSIVYYLLICIPFLMLGISYWVGINFTEDNTFFRELNKLLNARASMAHGFMTVLTPKLWGQHVEIGLVENAYLVSLYNYGILPTLLELILTSYAIKRSLDVKNYRKTAALVSFSIHGFAEVSTINPFFNVALLTVLSDINNKRKL